MASSPASSPPNGKVRALVDAWLVLDFFGDARRTGAAASSLTTTIFSQSFLSLVLGALLYPEPPPVPFAAAMLCLSTLLLALGALDLEQALPRRRADRVLLGTAPIGPLQAAIARAAHAGFRTVLVTVGMALPPGILLACRQHTVWLLPAYLAASCVCTALGNGTLAVLLLAARRFLGAPRTALLAGTSKALLLGFGVVLFVLGLPALRKDADALPIGRLGAELLPPYHCAKLLAEPVAEAWRLLPLLGGAVALLLAAAWLGEREREGRDRAPSGGVLARLLQRATHSPAERGLAAFVAAQLWRSPGLRAHALPLLGIPAGVAFLALRGEDTHSRELFVAMALQFPGIYLPFVVAFLPRSDHAGAGWLFASAPALPPGLVQRATWLALATHLLLPVHALAWTVLLIAGAPPTALLDGAFALLAATLLARAMLRDLPCVPFARDEGDGDQMELGNVMAFAMLLAGAGAGFALAPPIVRIALLIGAVLALLIALRAPTDLQAAPAEAATQAAMSAHKPKPAAQTAAQAAAAAKAQAKAPPTLRRELAAIAFLYAVVTVLPLLIGFAFAPAN